MNTNTIEDKIASLRSEAAHKRSLALATGREAVETGNIVMGRLAAQYDQQAHDREMEAHRMEATQ